MKRPTHNLWFWGAVTSGTGMGLSIGRFAKWNDAIGGAFMIAVALLNLVLYLVERRRARLAAAAELVQLDAARELLRTLNVCPACRRSFVPAPSGEPATGGVSS